MMAGNRNGGPTKMQGLIIAFVVIALYLVFRSSSSSGRSGAASYEVGSKSTTSFAAQQSDTPAAPILPPTPPPAPKCRPPPPPPKCPVCEVCATCEVCPEPVVCPEPKPAPKCEVCPKAVAPPAPAPVDAKKCGPISSGEIMSDTPPSSGRSEGTVPLFSTAGYQSYEILETILVYRLLRHGACRGHTHSERALAVDVGAAFGWYTQYLGKLGCRVLSFEPQKDHWDGIRHHIANNQIGGHVSFFPAALSNRNAQASVVGKGAAARIRTEAGGGGAPAKAERAKRFTATGVNGTMEEVYEEEPEVDGAAAIKQFMEFAQSNSGGAETGIKTIAIGSVVPDSDIELMKVDVEGAEVFVWQALSEWIKSGHRTYELIVEVSPVWWKFHVGSWEAGLDIMMEFMQVGGYEAYAIYDKLRETRADANTMAKLKSTFDTDDMHHIQRIPTHMFRQFVMSLKRSLDIWFHLPASKGGHKLMPDTGVTNVETVRCIEPMRADLWAHARDPECYDWKKSDYERLSFPADQKRVQEIDQSNAGGKTHPRFKYVRPVGTASRA